MKIGFIGIGNMGSAVAVGVSKAVDQHTQFLLSNHNQEKANSLSQQISQTVEILDNETIASSATMIFLGLKPSMIVNELHQLSKLAKPGTIWVSMATGVSIEQMESVISDEQKVIRIMPNTPVAIGQGMTTYILSDLITDDEHQLFKQLMSQTGQLMKIVESKMNAASAVAGCGPAFIYQLIEALADGGVRAGLPREMAQRLAAQMVQGSAQMVIETGQHPGALKDAVTSPGGSTIAGVASLEQNGFRHAAMEAVYQSFLKTKSMSQSK
ncbi:pyrroline-5-carboxylate reductase [Globicatella sanguinis]